MRLDYRSREIDIPVEDFIRALVTVAVQQFNTLRSFHSLPPITRDQVVAAIKNELKNLT